MGNWLIPVHADHNPVGSATIIQSKAGRLKYEPACEHAKIRYSAPRMRAQHFR
jgi:hypothetical protein